ncbi:MAG: toxin-antitoxin system HicB family antitoxin [Acidobacteria bacterium]|nr:toxin-antitoxin system HicB family antitoxin [Acidobacteriota bacterium]
MAISLPDSTKSGRFLLRLPPPLHAMLEAAARDAGLSLNEYCVRRLATGGPGALVEEPAAEVVARAARVAGDALIAVVLHGSLARREATAASDADVLVVVESSLALNRSVYRDWDSRPVTWGGRRVDAHFAHPPADLAPNGLWAEAALDGIVLFERGRRLSAHLGRVRRAIADGRLVRRVVHGQPYWTAAA